MTDAAERLLDGDLAALAPADRVRISTLLETREAPRR
jgi:hypothetical protein